MKRSDREARTRKTLNDLKCLITADQPNGWRKTLELYAEKGYPTGGDNTGGSNEISRPTERLALSPDTPPMSKLKRLDELCQAIADHARELHAIYQWTVHTAKYDGPEPRPCIVLECDREISMIGSDIARNGRCPRCAQHYRRYETEWPHKQTQTNRRAS